MKTNFVTHLKQIPLGQIQTLLCDDIDQALYSLNGEALDHKTVVHVWDSVPPHEIILQDTLRNLAEIALGMWPAWYGQPTIYLQPAHLELLPSEQIYAFHPNISPPWFQRASQLCQKSKLPLIKKLPRNLQLSQLALTIDPNNLTFILAICDPTPLPDRVSCDLPVQPAHQNKRCLWLSAQGGYGCGGY